MIQNEIDILSKDLCARLPYGVKVLYDTQIFEVQYIEPMYGELKLLDNETYTLPIEEVKPYLFPMSSMTEEQIKEVNRLSGLRVFPNPYVVNWYLENHIDIYGLIPKGLALDATNLNIY